MRAVVFFVIAVSPHIHAKAVSSYTPSAEVSVVDTLQRPDRVPFWKKFSRLNKPAKAAVLSAIIPGLGQAYNRAYWKIPFVWAIVGGIGYLTVDNYNLYRKVGLAYLAKQLAERGDFSKQDDIPPELRLLSSSSLRNYRDQFRSDVDLYGLLTLFTWGLNVMEAAVHAHLKQFDVSPTLTVVPFISPHRLSLTLNLYLPVRTKSRRARLLTASQYDS